jgi:hypothetical protein
MTLTAHPDASAARGLAGFAASSCGAGLRHGLAVGAEHAATRPPAATTP